MDIEVGEKKFKADFNGLRKKAVEISFIFCDI